MRMLIERAAASLRERDPGRKLELTRETARLFREYHAQSGSTSCVRVEFPGRPERPGLVHHTQLAPRGLGTVQGRAAFLHALAHIEFNAINLAWDAVCRFPGLPADYYRDWSRVAEEEASHFRLLAGRLGELGYAYGDFPAHDGLWEMAEKTAHDVLIRMALVPRVLEARGLDVTPGMLERLAVAGDDASVLILQQILADEIGHVRIGSHWFQYLCELKSLDPLETFARLLEEFGISRIRKPLNVQARSAAGFADNELALLDRMAGNNS